jgi:hypothetical protein
MGRINKNQLGGQRGGRNSFYEPDSGTLRKHNYSTGAGWKTRKGATIGGKPQERAFDIRRKRRG